MTGRVVAVAVMAVVLAGCGGSSSSGHVSSPAPSHASSAAPRLSLSAFDVARLGIACDQVRTAQRRIGAGDPAAKVAASLSGAASGFASISAPSAQRYAGALRAAMGGPSAARSQAVVGVLAVCRANGD